MKPRLTILLWIFTASLIFVGVVAGQQSGSADERINDLKVTIQQYETVITNASAETRPMHGQRLKELRVELLALLNEKRRVLRTLRDEIPDTDKAFLSETESKLRNLEPEINATEAALGHDLAATATTVAAKSSVVPKAGDVDGDGDGTSDDGATSPPKKSLTLSSTLGSARVNHQPKPVADDGAEPQAEPTKANAAETANPQVLPDCKLVRLAPKDFSGYAQSICALVFSVVDRKTGDADNAAVPTAGLSVSADEGDLLPVVFRKLAKDEAEYNTVVEAEEKRTDKQTGGDPANPGSTSLVVKGGAPSAFGWAVENGAATASASGTTVTFRFNPVGLMNALSNKGYITGYKENDQAGIPSFLKNASIGVSFDANRGKDPGIFSADKRQISAISARYVFVNERDPRNKKYEKDWENFIARDGLVFNHIVNESLDALEKISGPKTARVREFKDAALQNWLIETNQLLAKVEASPDEIQKVLTAQLDKLPIKDLSSGTVDAITNFSKGLGSYQRAKKALLETIAKGKVITFEYTNHREVNIPDTSDFRFIAESGTSSGIDYTANASLTMFNKKPVGVNIGRIRNFQFAGQLDVPVGDALGLGQSVLSFGGRYERLVADAMTAAGTLMPNTKGDLAFGQVKLTLPIKGTGFKIPISLTFSNRTELIKEREVRGNFGFTFDLDTIFAKFKPF